MTGVRAPRRTPRALGTRSANASGIRPARWPRLGPGGQSQPSALLHGDLAPVLSSRGESLPRKLRAAQSWLSLCHGRPCQPPFALGRLELAARSPSACARFVHQHAGRARRRVHHAGVRRGRGCTMISNVAHFVWMGRKLPFFAGLAIRSAALRGEFDVIIPYHTDPLDEEPRFAHVLICPASSGFSSIPRISWRLSRGLNSRRATVPSPFPRTAPISCARPCSTVLEACISTPT